MYSEFGGGGGVLRLLPTTGARAMFCLNFATGEPGKIKGRDRVGIVEGPCWYRASIRGKFVLSRNPGTRRGVAMWLNVVLIPG